MNSSIYSISVPIILAIIAAVVGWKANSLKSVNISVSTANDINAMLRKDIEDLREQVRLLKKELTSCELEKDTLKEELAFMKLEVYKLKRGNY